MTRDFEERLRRSLEARAADVTPDPAMFAAVQSRIRRRRFARWSLAGAGAAALVAVGALVFPAMTDRRVEFEPAPVVTQPPSEAPEQTGSGAMPVPDGMVFTDGAAIYSMALDGESAVELLGYDELCPHGECNDSLDVAGVALDPLSPTSPDQSERYTLAYSVDHACGRTSWAQVTVVDGEVTGRDGSEMFREAVCGTAPVYSPRGEAGAWAVAGVHSGEWSLETVAWSAHGPRLPATFGLEELDLAFDVTVTDWVWTEDTPDFAAGYLVITARTGGSDAAPDAFSLPVERKPDGAVSVTGQLDPLDHLAPVGGGSLVDVANAGRGAEHVTYTLEVGPERDDSAGPRVVRHDDDLLAELALPAEVVQAPDADPWLDAFGDTVAFGDGRGQAWLTRWADGAWEEPTELDATITSADLFARIFGGGAATPGEVPDPAPEESAVLAQVDVYFAEQGSECGESVTAYPRPVDGRGVLRGALEHLLAGPTGEDIAAGASGKTGFGGATTGLLNDVSIANNGVARVDFDARLAEHFVSTSCASGLLFQQLEPTVRQFASVEEVVYSFDGSIEAFYTEYQSESPPHRPDIPLAVTRMQERIRRAVETAQDGDYGPLAELIDRETFSCSFSDQNEDCIALWQQQEAEGQDPLGPLADILRGEPAKNPDAPIWVWPAQWMTDDEYLGPRTGIQRDGTWRYYQQGGD